MNNLETAIIDSLRQNELTSITFRITDSTLNSIDEMAGMLNLTRQNTLSLFVKDGLERAEEIIGRQLKQEDGSNDLDDLDDLDDNEGTNNINYYLLNTNTRHHMDLHNEMLREGIASAIYGNWKLLIDKIKKGDRCFLYQNGVGIVATGVATGKTVISDVDGVSNEKHHQKLTDFVKNFSPITAKSCKDITKTNIPFLRTMTRLTQDRGGKIFEEIQTRQSKR